MKKKILLIAVLAVMVTGCGSIPKLKNGEEAIVELKDGTTYSVDDIWGELKDSYALQTILKKVDAKILESVYEDNKSDVDDYLSSTEAFFRSNYETEEAMLYTLNNYGYANLDAYLEERKTIYLTSIATEDFAKSKITDKEINDYYKNEVVGDIEAVHILVKPEGTSTSENNKAKEKAESIIADIKKDIKSGTSAEDAFKKYKDNEDVKFEDLGKFNKGKMVDAFEDAVFKLKKGAYTTTPVKTSYGYHIILKTNEYEKPTLEDAKEDVIQDLADKLIKDDKTMEAQAMNELRKKNNIKFYDDELDRAYDKYMNYLLNLKQ